MKRKNVNVTLKHQGGYYTVAIPSLVHKGLGMHMIKPGWYRLVHVKSGLAISCQPLFSKQAQKWLRLAAEVTNWEQEEAYKQTDKLLEVNRIYERMTSND